MTFRNILVATDFSESAQAALKRGQVLAEAFKATLHVVHVVTEPLHEPWSGFVPADSLMETVDRLQREARQHLEALMPHDTRAIVATPWGDAVDELLNYAKKHEIDLIVCGTHGRRGWNHLLLGSVAERVVRLATPPVLTVHAPSTEAAA